MKTRPILFNGEMVRAILGGRKTQTRRPVKGIDGNNWISIPGTPYGCNIADTEKSLACCPFGVSGDHLYVRETFAGDDLCGYVYRADHPDADLKRGDLDDGDQSIRQWTPSIHMPKDASRITLEVVNAWPEHVQEIGEDNAIAEGVEPEPLLGHDGKQIGDALDYEAGFAKLWDSIYKDAGHGWQANGWVWAAEFRVVTP